MVISNRVGPGYIKRVKVEIHLHPFSELRIDHSIGDVQSLPRIDKVGIGADGRSIGLPDCIYGCAE